MELNSHAGPTNAGAAHGHGQRCTSPAAGQRVAAGEARGFESALLSLSNDLQRLVESHRKERALVASTVNRLGEEKEALAREVARLESLLLSGGYPDKMAGQSFLVRAEEDHHWPVCCASAWQIRRDADARLPGVKALVPAGTTKNHLSITDREDPTADFSKVHNSTAYTIGHAKLRSAWDEMTQETIQAFSPDCNIDIANIYRLRSRGTTRHHVSTHRATFMRAMTGEEDSLMRLLNVRTILHPNSRPRLLWTVLTLFAVLYDVLTIPLTAFDLSDHVPAIGFVDLLFLLFWTCDIITTFHTGYYAGEKVEIRRLQIAIHYVKTWFFLDAFVVIIGFVAELALMSSQSSAVVRVARFFRILRILRLLRLAKLKQILDNVEDRINSNIVHLVLAVVKMVAGFAVIVHFCTCAWYAIGMSTDNGWPTYDLGEGHKNLPLLYSASLRWTLAQVNGRTDLDSRRNMREMVFTCFVAGGLAIILMAVFISSITTAMMELGAIAEERKKKVRRMNEFLKKNHISPSLTALVKHHSLETKNLEETEADDNEILSYLPRTIQSDLLYEIRAPLLLGHAPFSDIMHESKTVMLSLCNDAMETVVSAKGEVLFDLNDSCTRMLLKVKGILLYATPKDLAKTDLANTVSDGADRTTSASRRSTWSVVEDGEPASEAPQVGSMVDERPISEAALWIEWHNKGRLTAASSSLAVALSATAFGEAVKQHLGARARSSAYARAFIQAMKELVEVSDVMDVRATFEQPMPP